MSSRLLKILKTLIATVFLLFIGRIGYVLLTNNYPDVLAYVLDKMYKTSDFDLVLNNKACLYVYKVLKIGVPLLVVFFSLRLLRYLLTNKPIFFPSEDKPFHWLHAWAFENKKWFRQLDAPIRIGIGCLLLLQLVGFLYLVFTIPYHYDEAWTYTNFCGNSIISTFTYYPAPNNHILHNIIANYTLYLPLDEIVAIRLPSYLASFWTTWYFFKSCAKLYSQNISLLCTLLFSFSQCFIFYSTQARGYSLVALFSVACVYAFIKITSREHFNKYVSIYAVSATCGFVAIPSFLYFYVPTSIALFCMLLLDKRFNQAIRFTISGICSAVGTLLFYLPIILIMGEKSLTENNGVIKRSYEYIVANMHEHLMQSWSFLTGIDNLSLSWVGLALLGPIIFLFNRSHLHRSTAFLCLFLLLSPAPILLLHKVIPFPRTWIFLIAPLFLGLGFLASTTSIFLRNIAIKKSLHTYILVILILTYSLGSVLTMIKRHKKGYAMDYVSNEYVQLLQPYFNKIQVIRFNPDDFGFYLAENMQFEIFRHTGKKITLYYLDKNDPPSSELLILPKTDVKTKVPSIYQPVFFNDTFFKVYLRNDI